MTSLSSLPKDAREKVLKAWRRSSETITSHTSSGTGWVIERMHPSKKNKMSTLENAISLATESHKGQTDKNGDPYILHPLRVMARVQSETEKIAAILHDVIEDTDYTIENLREKGYSKEVLEAIDCLTKRDGEDYDEYLQRSKSNSIARKVKIADLEHNMDVRRFNILKEEDLKRLNKYLRAWKYMTKEEN